MIVATLLLAATAAAAPTPPAPPIAPAPPASFTAVAPPAPPAVVDGWDGQHQTIITRNVDGHRLTVIAREPGARSGQPVLSYKDAQGRDVQVYGDRAVSREEADRLLAEGRAEGERARAEGERAREQGRLAREAGARARVDAERIRGEAMESARRAVEAARLSSRDYADLGDVRALRVLPGDMPQVWVDGRRAGSGFAERPEVRALRDEVRALREELKSLRAELERTPARR